MEKADNVRVLEVVYDWNDVGDWRALTALVPPDAQGNTIQGDVLAVETTNSIIVSDDGGLIATLGRRRPGDRPVGRRDPGRPQGPARQAQGARRGARQRRAHRLVPVTRPSDRWRRILGPRFRHPARRRGRQRPAAADRHAAGGLRAPRPGQDARHYRQLVDEHEVDRIVIGLPVHTGGARATSASLAREWGDWLAEVTGLPGRLLRRAIHHRRGRGDLIAAGFKRQKRKGLRDMLAAQILLQNYLDAGCPETEAPRHAPRRSPRTRTAPMTTLIVGCGYLGRRVGARLVDRGERGLRHRAGRPAARRSSPSSGVEPVIADVLDADDARRACPTADRVVLLRRLRPLGRGRRCGRSTSTGCGTSSIGSPDRPGRLVYASSTGVYGQATTATGSTRTRRPSRAPSPAGSAWTPKRRRDGLGRAERLGGRPPLLGPVRAGPDRPPGDARAGRADRGRPEQVPEPDPHRRRRPGRRPRPSTRRRPRDCIWSATTARSTRIEYYSQVADCLNGRTAPDSSPPRRARPKPRATPPAGGCRIARLKAELGVKLAYPDIITGVPAALDVSEVG